MSQFWQLEWRTLPQVRRALFLKCVLVTGFTYETPYPVVSQKFGISVAIGAGEPGFLWQRA